MAAGQVSVDAKAMGEGMAQAGHMAMHGIRFVTDSAALTADSDATLAQMTVLLKSQPALKVYIVGHTACARRATRKGPEARSRAGRKSAVQGLASRRRARHTEARRSASMPAASRRSTCEASDPGPMTLIGNAQKPSACGGGGTFWGNRPPHRAPAWPCRAAASAARRFRWACCRRWRAGDVWRASTISPRFPAAAIPAASWAACSRPSRSAMGRRPGHRMTK